MKLRLLILSVAMLVANASVATACPHDGAKSASFAKPRSESAAALLSWKPRAWTPPVARVANQGLQVAIDPNDGTLSMPAPGELANSVDVGEEDRRPVSVVRRANGAGRVQLDDRWANHAVVTIGADGKPRWTCVDDKKSAERFLKNAASTVPAPVWEVK